MKTPIILAALLISTSATAQVNKCEIDGQVTYQSAPCPQDAAAVELVPAAREPQAPPSAPVATTREQATTPTPTEIRAFCAHRWNDDFRMRNYCLDQQSQAWRNLVRQAMANRDNDRIRTIAINCLARWKQDIPDHGYDWRMAEYCYNQQTEAARSW